MGSPWGAAAELLAKPAQQPPSPSLASELHGLRAVFSVGKDGQQSPVHTWAS